MHFIIDVSNQYNLFEELSSLENRVSPNLRIRTSQPKGLNNETSFYEIQDLCERLTHVWVVKSPRRAKYREQNKQRNVETWNNVSDIQFSEHLDSITRWVQRVNNQRLKWSFFNVMFRKKSSKNKTKNLYLTEPLFCFF